MRWRASGPTGLELRVLQWELASSLDVTGMSLRHYIKVEGIRSGSKVNPSRGRFPRGEERIRSLARNSGSGDWLQFKF